MLENIRKAHFIGIGGVGMSALARVLLDSGRDVSGSDLNLNSYTEALSGLGATIHRGHSPENLEDADAVVYSSAVSRGNPELARARELGIPAVHRSVLLGELMKTGRSIAVTGTHGKTTTTSMLASVLRVSGFEPTVLLGGDGPGFGNAVLGSGKYIVCEADESDGSFLNLDPDYAVITNIEEDHLEHYGSFERLKTAFSAFARKVFDGGGFIAFSDHPANIEVLGGADSGKSVCFGFGAGCGLRGAGFTGGFGGSSFSLHARGKNIGVLRLAVPGIHNAYNALGAAALALRLGAGFGELRKAFSEFSGVRRRFEKIGEVNGVLVMEDYAHHPAELRCTLASAKESGRRVIAVFQPHRFSRTGMLFAGLGDGLSLADRVVITDIYPAGEAPIEGITSKAIADSMSSRGHPAAAHIPMKKDVPGEIARTARPGDIVIILGAGDINSITPGVLKAIGGAGAPADHEKYCR